MPKVPVTEDRPVQPVTGDQYVAPENLLIAAAHMKDTGRLFEGGDSRFGSLKPKKSGKVKR